MRDAATTIHSLGVAVVLVESFGARVSSSETQASV
jgi:hypothetical protein